MSQRKSSWIHFSFYVEFFSWTNFYFEPLKKYVKTNNLNFVFWKGINKFFWTFSKKKHDIFNLVFLSWSGSRRFHWMTINIVEKWKIFKWFTNKSDALESLMAAHRSFWSDLCYSVEWKVRWWWTELQVVLVSRVWWLASCEQKVLDKFVAVGISNSAFELAPAW